MTEPTLYPESGFLRLRIDLAYDGTNYSGWAKQLLLGVLMLEFMQLGK
jgi:hypothetical protein